MVMTSEGMLSLATRRPLSRPQTAPVAKAANEAEDQWPPA